MIVDQRQGSTLAPSIAPGQNTIGVMLPYTPLHYLLLEKGDDFPSAVVMTSGNYSEEPIDTDNQQAFEHLSGITDGYLVNDRDIHMRCDDSVLQSYEQIDGSKRIRTIRRSRGFSPNPIMLDCATG